MKILVDHCLLDHVFEDSAVKFGIGWYRHHKSHKWWGLTVQLYLFKWMVSIDYVSNWPEYDKKMNFRKKKK